jgi:hypothetical protein
MPAILALAALPDRPLLLSRTTRLVQSFPSRVLKKAASVTSSSVRARPKGSRSSWIFELSV